MGFKAELKLIDMAIIKKPIYKILLYFSSLGGLIFAFVTGIFLGNSQYNFSQLKNKAESIFGLSDIVFSQTSNAQCWTTSSCVDGGCGSNDGCGSGDGCGPGCSTGGSSGDGSCCW